MQLIYKTKQILLRLFLLCFAFISYVSAQPPGIQSRIGQAQLYFDNGNYSKSIEIANAAVEEAKKAKAKLSISKSLEILAGAQISLQQYREGESNLKAALEVIPENESTAVQKARILLNFARLYRAQDRFAEALDYSKKAAALLPNNQPILAEHYLSLGRILYTSGYDLSAIIWLEKAENLLEKEKTSSAKLDTYRFLALAWWAKLNYRAALTYTGKWERVAENTRFKQSYRQALFDSATILSESGQTEAAFSNFNKGLNLARTQNNSYQAGLFLTSLLLNSLDNNELVEASGYLAQLEKVNDNTSFSFEILLGKAIIAAYKNEIEKSNALFAELEKMEYSSPFIIPGWRLKIAERRGDWEAVIAYNQKILDLTIANNFRDELPSIYLDFAESYFLLGKKETAKEYLEKSVGLIEEIRRSGGNNSRLSLGILETFHQAYRLLTEIKADQRQEAFESADYLKARILNDRIGDAALVNNATIPVSTRQKLEQLSLKFIDDQSIAAEIEKTEKAITAKIPDLNLQIPDLSGLDKISDLKDTAIVAYFFTLDKKLTAYVWEQNQPLRSVVLPVSEDEVEIYAKSTEAKIKNFIFFKRDGREMYDKLVKPLNIEAKHIIFIPDKSLWKIPFQALSADGEKYLIEDKLITYAPSVSVLLKQVEGAKSNRQTLQAFANPTYNNQFLRYVGAESEQVAAIYNSKPVQNATVSDFERNASNADILHFSMHAQVDSEQPLDSFLAFRKSGSNDDGHLTVGELLKVKMKKGSLAFLASCDTNNVLNGEGLVSLAWAMMGSGATTVVSAQWEANDKSTEVFSKAFYNNYKQGSSSAEAIQKASLELIKNKSNNMHEPYYWANFTLNGDFR